jgi:hypothetical protein
MLLSFVDLSIALKVDECARHHSRHSSIARWRAACEAAG